MATHHEVTDHKQGEMDITQQERTFAGFVKMATWVIIIALCVLAFIALVNA